MLRPQAENRIFSRILGFGVKTKDLSFEAKAKNFKMSPRGLHLWLQSCKLGRAFRVGFGFEPGSGLKSTEISGFVRVSGLKCIFCLRGTKL